MPQLHETLEQIHVRMAYVFLVALGIHVLGTIKHLLFERQLRWSAACWAAPSPKQGSPKAEPDKAPVGYRRLDLARGSLCGVRPRVSSRPTRRRTAAHAER